MRFTGEEFSELQVRILKYLYDRRPGLVREDQIFREVGEGKVPFHSEIEKSLPYFVEQKYIAQEYTAEGKCYKILAKGVDYVEIRNKN